MKKPAVVLPLLLASVDFSGWGNLRGLATYTGHLTGNLSADGRTLTATNTVTFTEPDCRGEVLIQQITGTR